MKLLLPILLFLALLSVGFLGSAKRTSSTTPSSPPLPVLAELEELAELTSLRVPVSDVVTRELHGYVGAASATLVVHGSVRLGVDLGSACFENVDQGARTAVLRLPRAMVMSTHLDHQRTRLDRLNRHGLWLLTLTDAPSRKLLDGLYRDAEADLAAAGTSAALLARAESRAAAVLRGVLSQLGWKVTVLFDRR